MAEKKASKRQKGGGSESAKSGRKLKKKKSEDEKAEASMKSKKVTKSKRAQKAKKGNPPPAAAAKADVSTKGKKKPKMEKTTGAPAPSVMVTQMNRPESEEASRDNNNVTVMPSVMPTVMPQTTVMQQPTVMKTVMPAAPKGPGAVDTMSPAGEKSAELFFNHVCEMSEELMNSEWDQVNAVQQPATTNDSLIQQHATDPTIPCFNPTRVKVENMPNDFYHSNRLSLEKTDRKWIIAQPPKDQMQEAFWRMVFQENAAMVLMLGPGYDQGKKQYEDFFPQKKDEYKYFGAMYVNNKKVETDKMITIYSLEVLPEGCSNSIVTKLVWSIGWQKSDMAQEATCLAVLAHVHKLDAGATVISVSASGTGRACVTTAISVLGARICNGGNPDVVDVVGKMKQQRARAVPDKAHFMFIYSILAQFVKMRMKDKKKWDQAVAQLKEINTAG